MSSPPQDHDHSAIHTEDPSPSSATETPNPLLRTTNPLVSSLEQEVLDEYTRLLGNVNKVRLPPNPNPINPRSSHPLKYIQSYKHALHTTSPASLPQTNNI